MRVLVMAAVLFAFVGYLMLPKGGQISTPKMPLIAHAGGGIAGQTHTNSLQALDRSYEAGFRYIEIDFSWTKDDHLVCLNNWDEAAEEVLRYRGRVPLTLVDFDRLAESQAKLTPCNLNSLNQWLIDNPGAFIITDIKDRNIEGLAQIVSSIDTAQARIIPQFYQAQQYQPIRDLKFENIIWTLYRYTGSADGVINHVGQMELYAVTMPEHRVKAGLAESLAAMDVPTYAHTINNKGKAKRYVDRYSVSSIYTDFLTP